MKASHDKVFKSAGHFSIVTLNSASAEFGIAANRPNKHTFNKNRMARGLLTVYPPLEPNAATGRLNALSHRSEFALPIIHRAPTRNRRTSCLSSAGHRDAAKPARAQDDL
jgi:hypothetical protein